MRIEELKNSIEEMLAKRIALDPNDPRVMDYWQDEISFLSENLNETIDFIKNRISDETFYWLSEVFEDVAEKTQSVNFYNAVKERLNTVQDAEYKRSISVELEFMAGAIEADVNQGELPL